MSAEAPRLFPFPLVEGVEGLYARHSRTGRAIYLTLVLGLLVAVAALPLIEVEVNSQSRGFLRPAMKLTPVTCPVGGRVTLARLEEDRSVCAGDTLLIVSTAELDGETDHLQEQRRERHLAIKDLRQLTSGDLTTLPQLHTAVYQRDHRDYQRRHDELELKLDHARRHLERQTELLETGSVARMDHEQAQFEVELLEGQLRQLSEQQRHQWTQELQRIRRESAELTRNLRQTAERSKQHVITAPVDGHLTQTGGLQVGGYAGAGQTLAQISPDGDLRVEAFVSPSDIGLLREGLPVRLQLDAFNYNQWGLARATLSEISRDVTEVDGQAAFRVLCTLHDAELQLRNGYVGRLRKGMTLTAHFTLARRSLFQLLHDKLDDWFNPVYH
ncbi:HlyD family secretion protein [Lewinella sp. IMCC34191]|uniref:HlyD family secretion protein n=1 Tax=Lewinella sp. IMCC34191 TaxID=2259172 RepID=UPI000E2493CF|nr:HlyD family efflux transporter periplasmic adaptor subunit [Lewinella sp. IMCC34191]